MANIFEITYEDVKKLKDKQLTNILIRLLQLEADAFGIPTSCVSGTMEITVGDEGEDASIQWENGVSLTNWLPNRYTLFQCKATPLTASGCKKEICIEDGNKYKLKAKVKEVFDNGGCYILFFTTACNKKQKESRIAGFREAIKQCGESYADTANIQIYDANSIALWINQYLPSIVSTCEYVGRSIPLCAQTWNEWSKYKEFQDYKYVLDDLFNEIMQQLRTEFTGVRKIARIVGLSGLGKTRLALETFRPPESNQEMEQLIRSSQVIYIDSSKINQEIIPAQLIAWRSQKLRGTIIVDNCDLKLHNLLVSEIRHSENLLNLLTLDYTTDKDNENYPIIELKPSSTEVIKKIIEQGYPGLPNDDLDRIVEFAEGFPQMAVLLADARLNELHDIGRLQSKEIMEKLLWGRGESDNNKLKVISSCAIFEYVGFYEEKSDQRKFIADHICGIDGSLFYELAHEFIEKGILDRTGRYVRVTPRPLAIRLAADWWKNCEPERAKSLILKDLPPGMTEALCNQMSKLHFLKEAQDLTKDLCGNQAPFGQAEILNSEKGSRLFRSLVEVNPRETVKAIRHAFGGYSIEELRQVGPGRRNLVGALEKLCFWEETFIDAAEMMLNFAIAENESWGNNATNQIIQLFQAFLSGTQAPPAVRMELIDYALSKRELEYDTIAIQMLSQVLETQNFTRMGGVETQGSRPSQSDWNPNTWGEVFAYWREGLYRLTALAISDKKAAEKARDAVAHRIRGLVQYGLMDELESSIAQISNKVNKYWPEALESIRDAIEYEGPSIPEEGQKRLNQWLNYVKPSEFRTRLKLIVSIPSWNYNKEEEGEFIDISIIEAKDLAIECSKDIEQLLKNIDVILSGEQRQGFIFGFTLANSIDEDKAFISQCIETLEEINDPNPIVLAGFLAAIKERDKDLVKETLSYIANNEKLNSLIIDITRLTRPEIEDLLRIIELVETNRICLEELRSFMYGSVLSHLNPEEIKLFTDKIIEIGQNGDLVALEILHMYCLSNEDKRKLLIPQFASIISKPGILCYIENSNHFDSHIWKQTVFFILKDEPQNSELAKIIASDIISYCSKDSKFYKIVHTLRDVLKLLLQDYKEHVWSIFSNELLNQENLNSKYNIRSLFEEGLILELPIEFIISWCDDNSKEAPNVLCELIPIIISQENVFKFNPIIQYLIDKYGDREEVLLNINRNLGPHSWTNSIIPYYRQQIAAFNSLNSHELPRVRMWAQERINYLNDKIEKEWTREEEHTIGVFE